mmetsp:Transcript_41523/g.54662  ORF Transcript_41523/g.54662 Transcript_41523/m.54662 type:complete len:94 (-) Transcript_41523:21-302(-)
MTLGDRLRSFDFFGHPVNLKLSGKASYPTLVGGFASIILRIVVLGYFCQQLLSVASYQDNEISSYTIVDTREVKNETVSMQDQGLDLYFSFAD